MIAPYLKSNEESKGMDDDLIFLLSVNIMGLFIINLIGRHYFGLEASWSVINTMATMYYCWKNQK